MTMVRSRPVYSSLLTAAALVSCVFASPAEAGERRGYKEPSRSDGKRMIKRRRPASATGDGVQGARHSEFFHQAEAGRLELVPGIGLIWGMPQARSGKASYMGTPLSFKAEYGIAPIISVALTLKYDSLNAEYCGANGSCVKAKSAGLFDPLIEIKARQDFGGGVFLYGAAVAFAVEKGKADTSGERNNATGGATISPYVGYEMEMGAGLAGGKLSYDLYKGDAQRDYAGSSFSVAGGQVLQVAGFYEMTGDSTTYGGSLAYQSVSEMKDTFNGNTGSYNDANTAFILRYYMPIHTGGLTYVPAVSYTLRTYSSSRSAYSSSSEIFAGCDFRF